MIRVLSALVLLTATSAISAPTTVWEQHFNGTTLDPLWQSGAERFAGYPAVETRWANGEFQQYVPGQVRTELGRLVITARPMTPADRETWLNRVFDPKFGYVKGDPAQLRGLVRPTWLSGQISTYPATPFAPGTKMTVRMFVPVGQNAWGAAWGYSYTSNTEIDVFEGSGRPATDPLGNFSQGIHDFKSGPLGYHVGCPKMSSPTSGEHEFSADWTDSTKITFARDGIVTCTVAAGPRMTQPMSIIVNLAVGSATWPWIGVPNDKTPTSLSMRVNWIKVEKP